MTEICLNDIIPAYREVRAGLEITSRPKKY
jgi:hypothetical protein